jgi:DNA-binding beta-propeller fold protein YncE
MGMNTFNKIKGEHRSKTRFLILFLSFASLCLLFFTVQEASAQLVGTFMEYEESLSTDEEGEKFIMPSFVYAEPVKNEIYIIDARSRIMIYTDDLFPLVTLTNKDGIEIPQGLTVDKEGNLYVAQSESKGNPRNRISVFNACLKWERDIYLSGFEGAEDFMPHRMAIDKDGHIYVASEHIANVLVIDMNGRLLEMMSPLSDGRKVALTDVVIDKNGRIYLLSDQMGQVYVYDKNRQFLFQFGEKGGSSGKLSNPRGISVDNRNRRIYIVDYMRHTITTYDMEGNFLFEFGGRGWSGGWFQFPNDLTVDTKGRVWVADFFNNRIQVFSPRLLSKKIPTMSIVRITDQDFIGKSYQTDTLLGYSLQQRLKHEQLGYSLQQPITVEQRNQTIRFASP